MMGSIPSFTISFTQDVCTVSNLLTYGERLSIPFVTFHDTQKVLNAHFVPSLQGRRVCTSFGFGVGFHHLLLGTDFAAKVHLFMRCTPRRQRATLSV